MRIRLGCLLIGYICGLFQTGYFVGKLNKIDIRDHGSGNAGATNTLRVLGPKMGGLALTGDALKSIIAVIICKRVFNQNTDIMPLITMYAGTGAVIGHNHPFYMSFKGGKGIASTSGVMIALRPMLFLVNALIFMGVVLKTRFVSLGSIVMLSVFFLEVLVLTLTGAFKMSMGNRAEMIFLAFFLTASAIIRHKKNIVRLKNGEENKISVNKK